MKWFLRTLTLVGVGLMVYLSKLHFSDAPAPGALCEFGEGFSCGEVNKSSYSQIAGVPISFLGAGYFSLVFLLTYVKQTVKIWQFIFLFTLFNLAPSLYFTGVELFVIDSICVFCELSKVLMVVILVASGKVLMDAKSMLQRKVILGVIGLGLVAVFVTWWVQSREASHDYDSTELAQCMAERGVVMYFSPDCVTCGRQKQIFGDAFEHITQTEKDGTRVPVFVLEDAGVELRRVEGLQTPEQLAAFSGCEM